MNPNKTPLALVPLWFVSEMALVLRDGLTNGRKPNDWQDIPWTEEAALEYRSALRRHDQAAEESTNARDCVKALAAVAVNAMILTYHEQHRVALRALPIVPPAAVSAAAVHIDASWHRLSGWISLVGLGGPAHYYDGPNAPLCSDGPQIPKGALRNLYDDPPGSGCYGCREVLNKRNPPRCQCGQLEDGCTCGTFGTK